MTALASGELQFIFNTLSFLLWGALVMWMAAGFTMLESGSVRTKNASVIGLKEHRPVCGGGHRLLRHRLQPDVRRRGQCDRVVPLPAGPVAGRAGAAGGVEGAREAVIADRVLQRAGGSVCSHGGARGRIVSLAGFLRGPRYRDPAKSLLRSFIASRCFR